MRLSLILFQLFVFFAVGSGQVETNFNQLPRNLDETIPLLEKLLADSTKSRLKHETEDKATVHLHLIAGMWISNNWGLWTESALKESFVNQGVVHPYYMTDIIFTTFYRHLNSFPAESQKVINKYKATFYGSMLLKNDTAYFPFAFFSFKSIKKDSILYENFKIGDIIYVSEFDRLDSSTPSEPISYSKAKVISIDSSKLKIQIIEISKKRKRAMKRLERRMKPGYVYDIQREVGLIYEESPENCGFILPKGLGFR
jgi:hypothetical protein